MATITETTQTEAKVEAAWVHALQQNLAFTAATPMTAQDQSATRGVPAVTVQCLETTPASEVAEDTFEIALVRVVCVTRKKADDDKAVINALVGAVRSVIFSANLEGWLEEPGPTDINVHNPLFDSEQLVFRDDSDADYHRKTVDVQSVVSLTVA